MTNIKDQLTQYKTELEQVVEQYNELGNTRQQLLQKASELNGAIKALATIDGDSSTEAEPT